MFTIIGGDGKEYGPVSTDQIRGWVAAGRANLDTKARAIGSEEWRRLADFPEFSAGGPPPMSGFPTAVPASSATGAVPQTAAVDPTLAHRGRRLGARVIDWFLVALSLIPGFSIITNEIMKLVPLVLQGQPPDFSLVDQTTMLRGGGMIIMGWLVVMLIQLVLLSLRGQSIGKILLGIRVVKVADGSRAGFLHAWLLREALMTVCGFLVCIVPLLGFLMLRPVFHLVDWLMIMRSDQRCLHDLIAGTKVVKL